MLESFTTDKFTYKRIPVEEQKKRGILGRLAGVIADTETATRNGRKYSLELWKNVFNNPIMKEKIANRCVFSELGHPEDREEVDMSRVCACLAEQPKLGDDGKIYGVFDILDTNNGRILKTLCDYGTTVGISSRGTGDLITDDDGNEAVDPDTYNCECWDIVIVPAVESARLQYVTESLDTKKRNKTLRQKLTEELDSASEEDRKVMKETLNELNINLAEDESNESLNINEPEEADIYKDFVEDTYDNLVKNFKAYVDSQRVGNNVDGLDDDYSIKQIIMGMLAKANDKDIFDDEVFDEKLNNDEEVQEECITEKCADKEEKNEEVVNDKSIVDQLQESLLQNKQLADDNLSLQEKLSVCNAKEAQLEEELKKKTDAIINLSEKAKEVKSLTDKVNKLTESIAKKDETIKANRSKFEELLGKKKAIADQLEESFKSSESLQTQVDNLEDQLEDVNLKLTESKETIKKYQKAYASLKENYMQSKADAYGLSKEAIKANLSESYSVKDIDLICEGLAKEKKAMSKLPFRVNESTSFKAVQSKDYSIKMKDRFSANDDDDVSGYLSRMVK